MQTPNRKMTITQEYLTSLSVTTDSKVKRYIKIREYKGEHSDKTVYKSSINLEGMRESENQSQEEVHMERKINTEASKTGPHKATARLDNDKVTTETFSFTEDGFPKQEMLSVYVTPSHELKSYHLYG